MNKKLIVLIGVSGSGKSTFAKKLNGETSFPIVNRDKIREMMFGYNESTISEYYNKKDLGTFEKKVTKTQKEIIKSFLKENNGVIIDNTHLKMSYINALKKDFYYCDIEFIPIEESFEVCLERDQLRTRKVGGSVIKKQLIELNILKKIFDFKPYHFNKPIIQQNNGLEKAIIFDCDGTLCIHDGRGAFEYYKCSTDLLCDKTYATYLSFKEKGFKIIVCTGREDKENVKNDTLEWLKKYNVQFDEFHIRPNGDLRPDYMIKEEMWLDISKRYDIFLLIDDRTQVVDHARILGLKVFQVADGDF